MYEELKSEDAASPEAIVIPILCSLIAIFVAALVITILHYKRVINLNRLKKRISKLRCCKCKCQCRKRK